MAESSEKIRTVLVDDEPVARKLLASLAGRDADIEVVGCCADGMEAVERVLSERPDLLILDVQMPGMNGFEVLENLSAIELPLVIFATAHDQHALRAIEVQAVDYLLKPFDAERFQAALERAKKRLADGELSELRRSYEDLLIGIRRLSEDRGRDSGPDRLAVKRGSRVDFVEVDDIDWIEAANQYVRIHAGDQEYTMRSSLGQLEQELDPQRFVRIHRSSLVAVKRIRSLETLGDGSSRVLLGTSTWLPVGRSYSGHLRDRLA